MTVLGDKVRHWCQEESLTVVDERDDEAALACAVSLPGDPQLTISVRASGPQPRQILLSDTFELPLPPEMTGGPEGQQRIAVLLERVASMRSALVACQSVAVGGKPAAEIVVTLHEDGIDKQCFLTALEEVRKVRRVVSWELEGMSAATDLLSDLRAITEQTDALASEMGGAAEHIEAPAAPEEVQAGRQPAAPEPEPRPAPTAPPGPVAAPAARFCAKCGSQAKPEQRFCIGCGTPLES